MSCPGIHRASTLRNATRNEVAARVRSTKQLVVRATTATLAAAGSEKHAEKRSNRRGRLAEVRTIAPIICEAVLLRREELAHRVRCLRGRSDRESRRAVRLLELLEVDLLRRWQWTPNPDVFLRNVEEITRKQIKVAELWHDEISEITGPTKRVVLERRVARLAEFERASHHGPVASYIYDTSVAVWKSTTGLGRPDQTSKFSSLVKSKSIRLIFGRIDCSHRVLEAQRKCLCQNIRIRSH